MVATLWAKNRVLLRTRSVNGMAQKIPIGARLDPETVERFDAMAAARGAKRSEYLVFLIHPFGSVLRSSFH